MSTTPTAATGGSVDLQPLPPGPKIELPEPLGYRIKNRLLGPPLHSKQLEHERLGIPTALAVFASDNLSSSAYATEEILRVLVPVVGVMAFSLVVPITIAMLVVLFFLILSYRETIKEYPTAGGAYMVTRDNFGLLPAQVAGVALLTDYVLTVSVSVAAGTAAMASAFPALNSWILPISIAWVVLIAYGNLRGVKESGRVFAVPTYWFILNMILLLVVGVIKNASGGLHPQNVQHLHGVLKFGTKGLSDAFFKGASLYVVLHAFASGGAAVTGVEAISNGVTAFRKPEWVNARKTLIIMGTTLGAMFLGLSYLSTKVHAVPFKEGTPTVISQVGKFVYGGGAVGHFLFYSLQAATTLILVLAANTSFADFPRLASFHAGDNFMPKQLTKRGHRLVFSNGIIALAAAAVVLLLVTEAKVDRLIPLYAIGVFTSFTLSQAGMAKHHVTRKEPGWKKGLFVNGTGAVMSLIVDIVIAITKFTHGAWVIVVLVPIMVAGLVRLNRQYESEAKELEEDAPRAAEAPILRRHVVLVFVNSLDLASARAIQYARSLTPDELRAVHFDLDPIRTEDLREAWTRLGLTRLPLEIIECPDRRVGRGAAQVVAEVLAAGDTEVSVLLPRLEYNRFWHRLLHDKTADQMAEAVGRLPHANVTFVPYHLGHGTQAARRRNARLIGARSASGKPRETIAGAPVETIPEGAVPIGEISFRQRVKIAGRVHSVRVQPWAGVATLETTIVDGSGGVSVVFLGRRHVAGIQPGVRLLVEGTVGTHGGRMAILNPQYSIIPDDGDHGGSSH